MTDLIDNLPANINVVGEEVPQHQVFKIFQNHDLFISQLEVKLLGMQSLNHFLELPVLISDKTLWKEDNFVLEVLELVEHLWFAQLNGQNTMIK